jgi:hypothetical protein
LFRLSLLFSYSILSQIPNLNHEDLDLNGEEILPFDEALILSLFQTLNSDDFCGFGSVGVDSSCVMALDLIATLMRLLPLI